MREEEVKETKNNKQLKRLCIWLPGQPARVTHQSGTRYAQKRTYKTKALQAWEAELMEKLRPWLPSEPIEGPVILTAAFGYKPSKKSDIGKWKITKPDTDNSIKTVKDVLTRLGFWKDDAQVVFEVCKKLWVSDPGISLVIEELAGDPEQWRIEDDD